MTQGTLEATAKTHALAGVDRRSLSLSAAAISIIAALVGSGIVSLVALVLAAAAVLGGRRTVVSATPPIAIGIGFAWVLALQIAALLHLPVLSSPWGARAALAAAGGVVFGIAAVRVQGRAKLVSRTEFWSVLPGVMLALGAVVLSRLPAEVSTVWFGGGIDNVNHTLNAVLRQQQGSLDYGATSRPGGWHAVLALILTTSTDGIAPTPERLLPVLELSGQTIWLAYALLVVTVGLLAHDWADTLPDARRYAGWAGAGAAALALGPSFFLFTMYLGFQTFIVAALAVVVLVREAARPAGWPWAAASGSSTVAWAAHSWPPSLAYVAVPWLALAFVTWRRRHQQLVGFRVGVVVTAAAAISILGLLIGLLPQSDVAGTVGVEGAAIAELPMYWLWGGVAALALLSALQRRALPLGVVLPGMVAAVALALRGDADVLSYYPRKLLWITALLGLAGMWAVAANLAGALRAQVRIAALVRAALGVSLASAVTVAGLVPSLAVYQPDRWESWQRTLSIVSLPAVGQAQVVWGVADTPEGDVFVSRILDYYSIETPNSRWPLRVRTPQEQCEILASAAHPAVLTPYSQEEVAARYQCVPDVRAIPITGD